MRDRKNQLFVPPVITLMLLLIAAQSSSAVTLSHGVRPPWVWIPIVVAALQGLAYLELRRRGDDAPHSGWLKFGSWLFVAMAVLFLVPTAVSDHVRLCLVDCSSGEPRGPNLIEEFLVMFLVGLATAAAAAIAWVVYLVQVLRNRPRPEALPR